MGQRASDSMGEDSKGRPACSGTEPAANEGSFGDMGFVGASPVIQRLLQLVRRIARTEANVLIRGETGTGKSWWLARCTISVRAVMDRSSR